MVERLVGSSWVSEEFKGSLSLNSTHGLRCSGCVAAACLANASSLLLKGHLLWLYQCDYIFRPVRCCNISYARAQITQRVSFWPFEVRHCLAWCCLRLCTTWDHFHFESVSTCRSLGLGKCCSTLKQAIGSARYLVCKPNTFCCCCKTLLLGNEPSAPPWGVQLSNLGWNDPSIHSCAIIGDVDVAVGW